MIGTHPRNTPFEQWRDSWLVFETASQLNDPLYIMRHEYERENLKQPASREARIIFIQEKRQHE